MQIALLQHMLTPHLNPPPSPASLLFRGAKLGFLFSSVYTDSCVDFSHFQLQLSDDIRAFYTTEYKWGYASHLQANVNRSVFYFLLSHCVLSALWAPVATTEKNMKKKKRKDSQCLSNSSFILPCMNVKEFISSSKLSITLIVGSSHAVYINRHADM